MFWLHSLQTWKYGGRSKRVLQQRDSSRIVRINDDWKHSEHGSVIITTLACASESWTWNESKDMPSKEWKSVI